VNRRLVTSALIVSLGESVPGYDLAALFSASQSLRSGFALFWAHHLGLSLGDRLWVAPCGLDRGSNRAAKSDCGVRGRLRSSCACDFTAGIVRVDFHPSD
jgi:hypothetical protein